MNEEPAPPPRGSRPRSRVRRIFSLLSFVGAGGGAVLWLLAGAFGLARSREALTPVRELRANLYAERSGGGVWAYGVRTGAAVLLFDAAADPRGRPLELLLTAMHAEPTEVAGIWATSARPDHLSGAAAYPAVPLFVGADDLGTATGRSHAGNVFDRVLRLVWAPPAQPRARALDPSGWRFAEGEMVHLLRAWQTPGPTPGSVVYLFDDVLFVGDLLSCREGKLTLPPRALDAEPAETRRSLARLAKALAPFTLGLVCTGHGGCTPEGQGGHAWQQLVASLGL